MFRKVTNIIAIIVFSCVLCCVVGTKALSKVGVEFPSWMGVGVKVSQLEGRTLQTLPKPTAESVSSGVFQKDADKWLSDHTPMRDWALIGHAALQRACIRIANAPFGFDVYPTFYDSDIAYSEARDALFEFPRKGDDAMAQALQERAEGLSRLVAAHSDKSFYLYAVPHTNTLDASPVMELVSNACDEAFFERHFTSNLHGVEVVNSHVDADEFSRGWFKTDHHWNIDGAYEGYSRIATALGFGDSLVAPDGRIVYETPVFFGSEARRGRITETSDRISDYAFDLGKLAVTINGTEKSSEDLAHRQLYASEGWSKAVFANHFAEYFHKDYLEIAISGDHPDSDRDLLLVANSYSDSIERLFTKHYATVTAFDFRRKNAPSLSDYLAAHPEIEDVVFLMNSLAFTSPGLAS